MGRRLLILLALATLMLAALPATAPAGASWSVRNNGGTVVGKCYLADGFLSVYRGSKYLGYVENDWPEGWWAYHASGKLACQILKVKGQACWLTYREDQGGTKGKAVRKGKKWVLRDKTSSGHFVTRGRVSHACPGQLAATALWLLW